MSTTESHTTTHERSWTESRDLTKNFVARIIGTTSLFWYLVAIFTTLFTIGVVGFVLKVYEVGTDSPKNWGYYAALVSFVLGNSIFALKMLPVFIYCFSSYIIFLISKKLENNSELAFLTATSFFLMPAVSFSSFFVSTDIVLIFFWSLALLQILTIKENPSSFNFILLGIFFGLAFIIIDT